MGLNVLDYFYKRKMKNEIPIFLIDFEGSKKLGVVEYGMVCVWRNQIVSSDTAICRPLQKISKKDEDFFDITNDEAFACLPFESAYELFADARGRGIFAAHNCGTEDSLLRMHIPSPGKVSDFFMEKETLSWSPWIDTRHLAKFLNQGLDSEKLSNVIQDFGLQNHLDGLAKMHCPPERAKWHCALYDALASALILQSALEKINDLHELASICKRPNKRDMFL